MKGRELIFTAIICLIVGVALIIFREKINSDSLVLVGGIFFIVAGVLNMAFFLGQRDKDGTRKQGYMANAFGKGASIGAVLLGLAMLIFRDRFVGLVVYMFAVMIAVATLYQFFLLISEGKGGRIPSWLYIAPIILVCGAVYLFIPSKTMSDTTVMIVTGVAGIVFGLAELIEGIYIGKSNHAILKAAKEQARADALASETKEEEKPAETAPEEVHSLDEEAK